LPKTKNLILIVIDGLTPSMFESAVGDGRAPALSFLAEQGSYSRAISTFPSLTPVCLSSIATGSHPDVHRIPHLVWYDRERARLVEYGSSFGAVRAAGVTRSLLDTTVNMNRLHLGTEAVTVYEALEDAGLTAAAINITAGADVPGLRAQALLLLHLVRVGSDRGAACGLRAVARLHRRLRGRRRSLARHA
jgi:hypothetical protein